MDGDETKLAGSARRRSLAAADDDAGDDADADARSRCRRRIRYCNRTHAATPQSARTPSVYRRCRYYLRGSLISQTRRATCSALQHVVTDALLVCSHYERPTGRRVPMPPCASEPQCMAGLEPVLEQQQTPQRAPPQSTTVPAAPRPSRTVRGRERLRLVRVST